MVSLFTRSVLAQSLANIERTGLVIEGVTPSLLGLLELIANLLLRVAEKKLFSSVDPVSASANQFIEEQHTFLCKTLEKWVSTVPANMSYPLSLPPSMDPDALEILRRVIQEDCNSLSSIFKSETITLVSQPSHVINIFHLCLLTRYWEMIWTCKHIGRTARTLYHVPLFRSLFQQRNQVKLMLPFNPIVQ